MLPICMSRITTLGSYSPTASRTSWPRCTSTTRWPGLDERHLHLVPDPGRFGRHEDGLHGAERYSSAPGSERLRGRRAAGEEELADGRQGVEVVDVVGEVRDEGDGRGPHPDPHRLEVAALPLGDLVEVGEVVVAGGEPFRGGLGFLAPGPAARAARRPRARNPDECSVPKRGWTRFTISASTARS